MKEFIFLIVVLSLIQLIKLGATQVVRVGPGSSYAAYGSPGVISAAYVSNRGGGGGGGGFPPGFPFGGGGQFSQHFGGAAGKPPVIIPMVFEYGDLSPDNYVQKGNN
jgi:hypothetical protein